MRARNSRPAGPTWQWHDYLQAELHGLSEGSERYVRAHTGELVGMTLVRARTWSLELGAGLADRALQRLVTRLAVGDTHEHAVLMSNKGARIRGLWTTKNSDGLAPYIERRQTYYLIKGSHELAPRR
jgi:hypothetical protein